MQKKHLHFIAYTFSFVVLFAGCTGDEKVKEAIFDYHFQQNRNTGSGQIAISDIVVKNKVSRNDTLFTLATITGIYTPPPLPETKEKKEVSRSLWYIMAEKNYNLKVVAIRDPDKFNPIK